MSINTILKLKNKYKTQLYLALIILMAFYLRTFNINWDSNYYFHPDERAIAMFTTPIQMPHNISEFLSTDSPLNPHFFAYGNFPLYFLRFSGEIASYINPIYKAYGGIHIIGRLISASVDTLTVFIVFLMGWKIFSKRVGLFASLLYALSVFPIQSSHFYTVDPLLAFFMTTTIFLLLISIQKPTIKRAVIIGIFFGLSLATKISAFFLSLDILFATLLVLINQKSVKRTHVFLFLFSTLISSLFVFVATQPYAIIDFHSFITQTQLQSQMSKNVFIFPYTLQYVGKIPYIYELKNIFFWGEGPIITTLNLLGIFFVIKKLKLKKLKESNLFFFLLFSITSYFLIFGKFAVGWMRYMLPIYPLICVFGGFFVSEFIISKIPKKYISNYYYRKIVLLVFLIILLVYPISFLSIYLDPNTRIQASDWISKNVPAGKRVAVEHWDDALPVYGGQNYIQLTLPLYEPDTKQKWEGIISTLRSADYIFIASNRLYKTLQRLTDCKHLQIGRCYPITSLYYKDLFSGKLGFKQIAEFSNYPTIPFINIKLIDNDADESFTVNDHPKIMIFKKFSESNYIDLTNFSN